VDVIRPGLRNECNRRTAGHPLLGVRGAGRDIYGLDRLFRGNVPNVVRQPDIHAGGAVNAGYIRLRIPAVDMSLERAARGICNRVLERRWGRAWHQVDQTLVVAVIAQRKIFDLLGKDFRMGIRLIRLKYRGRGFDRDLFVNLSDLQFDVRPRNRVRADVQIGLSHGPEARRGHLDVVYPGKDVHKRIAPALVRDGAPACSRLLVGQGNHGVRNDRIALVSDISDDRSIQNLRRRSRMRQSKKQREHSDTGCKTKNRKNRVSRRRHAPSFASKLQNLEGYSILERDLGLVICLSRDEVK
jgi:hypothetical protein